MAECVLPWEEMVEFFWAENSRDSCSVGALIIEGLDDDEESRKEMERYISLSMHRL
jgi:hypothetical protein